MLSITGDVIGDDVLVTRKSAVLVIAVIAALLVSSCGVTRGGEERGFHRLRMMVPNSPGGGYDLTARTAVKIMEDDDITGRVEVFNVIGAGGLLHTEQATVKAKAQLDITPWLQANYTLGLWSNDQKSNVQTYLRDAAGNPTFGGNATVGGSDTSAT